MSTKLSTFRCNKLYTAAQESSGWTKQLQPSPHLFSRGREPQSTQPAGFGHHKVIWESKDQTHKAPNHLLLGTIKSHLGIQRRAQLPSRGPCLYHCDRHRHRPAGDAWGARLRWRSACRRVSHESSLLKRNRASGLSLEIWQENNNKTYIITAKEHKNVVNKY